MKIKTLARRIVRTSACAGGLSVIAGAIYTRFFTVGPTVEPDYFQYVCAAVAMVATLILGAYAICLLFDDLSP